MDNSIKLSCFESDDSFSISSNVCGMKFLYSLWEKTTEEECGLCIAFCNQDSILLIGWPEPGFQQTKIDENVYEMKIEVSRLSAYGLSFNIVDDIARVSVHLKRGNYELESDFNVKWNHNRTMLTIKKK